MKKILATLLVATMLLSCMSILTFAATDVTVGEIVWNVDTDRTGNIKDAATKAYLDTLNDENVTSGEEWDWLSANSPLFKALSAKNKTDVAALANPYVYDAGEFVAFSIYSSEVVASVLTTVQYDPAQLQYVTCFGGLGNEVPPVAGSGKFDVGMYEEKSGYVGSVLFKVLKATGDENGLATTTVSMLTSGVTVAGKAVEFVGEKGVVANVSSSSMTFNLKGQEPGTTEEPEKPQATVENLAPIGGMFEATAENVDAAWNEIKDKAVSGDHVEYDVNKYGIYKIFFSKFVGSEFAKPAKQGIKFTWTDRNGDAKTVYGAAAEGTFEAGAPFGILVFGMGAQTELTAEPFIEY